MQQPAFVSLIPCVSLPQHHADNDIGVAVTDRYTHHVLSVLEGINKTSQISVQNLVRGRSVSLWFQVELFANLSALSSTRSRIRSSTRMLAFDLTCSIDV